MSLLHDFIFRYEITFIFYVCIVFNNNQFNTFVIEIIVDLKLYINLPFISATRPASSSSVEVSAKFCKNFGSRLEDSAKICQICGLPVEPYS